MSVLALLDGVVAVPEGPCGSPPGPSACPPMRRRSRGGRLARGRGDRLAGPHPSGYALRLAHRSSASSSGVRLVGEAISSASAIAPRPRSRAPARPLVEARPAGGSSLLPLPLSSREPPVAATPRIARSFTCRSFAEYLRPRHGPYPVDYHDLARHRLEPLRHTSATAPGPYFSRSSSMTSAGVLVVWVEISTFASLFSYHVPHGNLLEPSAPSAFAAVDLPAPGIPVIALVIKTCILLRRASGFNHHRVLIIRCRG